MGRTARVAVVLALVAACNPDDVVHRIGWFSTMRHQRSLKPYAMPLAPVPGTVPVTGVELDSLGVAEADRLANPRARTSESINRGQWLYETYCLVCHGAAGGGDGPISATAGGPFPGVRSLVDGPARARRDGYIYGVVINAQGMGRGLMPRYGDKIRGDDRWDVVNYVRTLQGRQAQAGSGR
ncbi:MAG: c-type cytochrome [Tepidiformaceae bacterium]